MTYIVRIAGEEFTTNREELAKAVFAWGHERGLTTDLYAYRVGHVG